MFKMNRGHLTVDRLFFFLALACVAATTDTMNEMCATEFYKIYAHKLFTGYRPKKIQNIVYLYIYR